MHFFDLQKWILFKALSLNESYIDVTIQNWEDIILRIIDNSLVTNYYVNFLCVFETFPKFSNCVYVVKFDRSKLHELDKSQEQAGAELCLAKHSLS